MPANLTEEAFLDWLDHPATRALKVYLTQLQERHKQNFVDGVYTLIQGEWASAMKQAQVIAECNIAQEIIELEFNQLGKYDDEEQVRT